MKDGQRSFLKHMETLFDAGAIGEHTDRELLQLFTGRDRTAAELAFTILVKRHGPMIFRACLAILHDPHTAEDAFQATFLVLARKAAGLWVRGSLGPWLLSVARRVACCARKDASRRRAHERAAAELVTPATDDQEWDDRSVILHEELGRLPEKYRTTVLLCDLGGLTQEQAARHLGLPCGTVRSRLARGRQRLRDRLTRAGWPPRSSSQVSRRSSIWHRYHWWRRLFMPPYNSRQTGRKSEQRRPRLSWPRPRLFPSPERYLQQ